MWLYQQDQENNPRQMIGSGSVKMSVDVSRNREGVRSVLLASLQHHAPDNTKDLYCKDFRF